MWPFGALQLKKNERSSLGKEDRVKQLGRLGEEGNLGEPSRKQLSPSPGIVMPGPIILLVTSSGTHNAIPSR